MDRFRYEITDSLEINIYDADSVDPEFPQLYQPFWPDGTSWSSYEEAEEWAKLYIEAEENSNSTYLPGITPSEPKILRVQLEEVQ